MKNIPSATGVNWPQLTSRFLNRPSSFRFQPMCQMMEPVVINNLLNWNVLGWDFDRWNEVLKDDELEFRTGVNKHTETVQWEYSTERVKAKFGELKNYQGDADRWLYFDYKYMNQWLEDKTDLAKSIDWGFIGFPEKSVSESVIWIGTKGAHTPCHVDTYGFNIVAQVFGRKLWILFPPEENLKPTRIPYEESSIYSKINFFSPNLDDLKGITNSRIIVLQPGQMLVVPNGWWHYVENLETAVSINMWLPLPSDNQKRLSEAITLSLVNAFSTECTSDIQKAICTQDLKMRDCLHLIEASLNECSAPCEENNLERIQALLSSVAHQVAAVPRQTNEEFYKFMVNQRDRFGTSKAERSAKRSVLERLLDAVTDVEVVELIKNKLLSKS